MAESDVDFTQYAGRVSFPRTPDDLTNTAICPACLNPLKSSVCTVCTLDLNHPAAGELFQLSTDAAAALHERLALIGRIRFETARLLEQQAVARATQAAPQSAPFPAMTPAPAAPAVAAAPPTAPAATPSEPAVAVGSTAPRRSSVQLVMLIVGVSLLSIAAIFFLVFAFITYGLLARSLIIGGITIAALVVASLLPRRGLRATAEGIAVFAAILVYLDAFAVRANDLGGLGSAEGAVFWGWALVGSAVAFVLWHRASGLRVPNIVGFAALAPGVGLLVGGLADGLDTPGRYFAAFAAAAVTGLAHPLARSKTDRSAGTSAEAVILLVISSLALFCGFFTAFAVQLDAEWGAATALIIVAAIGFAHAMVAGRAPSGLPARVVAAIAAGIGGVAAAVTGLTVALRSGDVNALLYWPVVVAAAIALVLEVVARRATTTYALFAITAAVSAGAVAGVAVLIDAGSALVVALTASGPGVARPWSELATSTVVERTTFSVLTIAAVATVVALVAASWAATGLFRRRGAILLWAFAAVVVLAVPLLETLWLVLVGWVAVSAVALALLTASARRLPLRGALRLPLGIASLAALVLAYSASWLSIDTWGWVTLATIAILLAARRAPDAAAPVWRAVLLGAAAVIALVGAAALARQLGNPLTAWQATVDALRFVGILATVLLATAFVARRAGEERGSATRALVVSGLERRTLFWISAPVALAAFGLGALVLGGTRSQVALSTLMLPEYGTSLILGLALLVALLAWSAGSDSSTLRPERAFAAFALAPVTFWIVDSFARVAQLPQASAQATPIIAGLLVSVGSLAVAVRGTAASPRWVRELGVAVVAVPSVLVTVLRQGELAWFVLLIAAVTALVLSISPDGLFASVSRRRHLGWLAVALATAGLWWRLGSQQVTAIEAYVLPLAAVLLAVAALIANSARGRARMSNTAPLVGLAGLLVAIVPIAADAADGPPVRAWVIGGVSALVLLGAAFSRERAALQPYLDAAALAGGLGVLVTSVGRGFLLMTAPGGSSDLRVELWIGAAFVVLVAAAGGIARSGRIGDVGTAGATLPASAPELSQAGHSRRGLSRAAAARILVIVAMTEVLAFEAANLSSAFAASSGLSLARAFVTLLLFLAIFLAGSLWQRAPFVPAVGWTGLGYAAVVGVIAIVTGALEPLELATVPVALALIADGVVRLDAKPEARSWPALGPGILVLLLPSLLATIDEQPLWRLVALGVVAIAVLIIGAVQRLQAPFVLGVVVALIHGIATFSSEIRVVYEALPWWLWLGFGGVLLIALAARYEKRLQNLKDAAIRLTSLR